MCVCVCVCVFEAAQLLSRSYKRRCVQIHGKTLYSCLAERVFDPSSASAMR